MKRSQNLLYGHTILLNYIIRFLKNCYTSKGEFDFRIKIFYSYLNKKGSTDYINRSQIDMDCRTY